MNLGYNLARVTTATVGTGTMTLGAAVLGYLTFAQAGVPNGAIVSYGIADGANSEAGWGVYNSGAGTLTRNVYRSTGSGNNTAISLSGAAQVFITALAEDFAALYSSLGIIKSDGAGTIAAAVADQDFAVPAWSVDLDFTSGAYWVAPYDAPNPLVCSRSSVGYVDDVSGNWTAVPANTLRGYPYTTKGALIEESRTNSIRNNSMQGAIAGSPGTVPTNWGTSSIGTLTQTIIGTGTENGVDYLDIRFNGTTSNTSLQIWFEAATQVSASTGQTWAQSIFYKLAAGSISGVQFQQTQQELTSGAGFVRSNFGSLFTPTGTLTRDTFISTLSGGATVGALRSGLSISYSNGATIDFTLRVGWPQLELGASVTSPIRTTSAAATRATDVVTMAAPPNFGNAVSIAATGVPITPTTYAFNQIFCHIDDGTNNNRVGLSRSGTGLAQSFQTVAGSLIFQSFAASTWGQGVTAAVVAAFANGSHAFAFAGSSPVVDSTAGAVPALSFVRIGANSTGGSLFNGYVTRVLIWPRNRLGNAVVSGVSANPPQAAGYVRPAPVNANVPPASVDLDFLNDIYWSAPFNPRNPFTVSRASAGTVDDTAGNWTQVAANVLRRSDKGLLIEEARTNSLRNNSMQGANTTPSTIPTNWVVTSPVLGLTQTVVGLGTESGIDYIDFRIQGTTSGSASGANMITFETGTQVAAVLGQTWTGSGFVKLVGGSTANITAFLYQVTENNSSGTGLVVTSNPFTPAATALGLNRQSSTRTLNNASVAFVVSRISMSWASGVAIDITLRIGWPQLELAALASSPIRTTSAAATRAADVVRLNLPPTLAAAHSLYAEATPAQATSFAADQYFAAISDGTTGNRFALKRTGATGLPAFVVNTTAQAIGATALAQSASARLAAANASVSQVGAVGGTVQQRAALAGSVAANAVEIGSDGTGGGQFNGRIARVVVWPKLRLDDFVVQNISGTPPDANGQASRLDQGTTAGDDAGAGRIGEYTSASGSGVALTSDVVANIASLMLTAGDWDVWGTVQFVPAGTTTTTRQTAAIHTVSATLPTAPNGGGYSEAQASYGAGLGAILPAGAMRLTLASATTVYLVARSTFAVSTMTASGFIGARRRR